MSPRLCKTCGARLSLANSSKGEDECGACAVAKWTPEKKRAFAKLLSMAFRKPPPTDEEKDAAIDEAFKHL